jgi:alpha-L-rhamnosidase
VTGKWIWASDPSVATSNGHGDDEYNLTAVFRKGISIEPQASVRVAITADSWYRLKLNGRIVNDGPARGWPTHYKYDVLDLTPYARPGENEIEVVVRYFGTGTFHQVPQMPGLLAEITIESATGTAVVATGRSWLASAAPEWRLDTPKISIQMEPFEHYDARETGTRGWAAAVEVCEAHDGPWQGLSERDCALLTWEPTSAKAVIRTQAVTTKEEVFCFAAARMTHPGLIEAQNNTSLPLGAATIISADDAKAIAVASDGFRLYVNGKEAKAAPQTAWSADIDGFFADVALEQGDNFVLALPLSIHGHRKDWAIALGDRDDDVGYVLRPPKTPASGNGPWSCFVVEEFKRSQNDMVFMFQDDPERDAFVSGAKNSFDRIAARVTDSDTYATFLADEGISEVEHPIVMEDAHYQFMLGRPVSHVRPNVEAPEAMLYDTPSQSTVCPGDEGDTELILDFGVQRCGCYVFDLVAEEGQIIDLFGVEFITDDGTIQHTFENRNGLRYVCKAGYNTFTSAKRRSGRYLFVTFRGLRKPIKIRHIGLIESTYPAQTVGAFRCSDPALERIYDISVRTLVLCMEDTYTDCPLYEQTLWVGDARNEALYALYQFGAADITRRCLRIAGESLERYPIVGCQLPSAWDCIIPVWSFLWGISVYEYYHWSGDAAFLADLWPQVCQNLDNAWDMRDQHGLFSGPYWNMFDWARTDYQHKTVIHNSMFFVGALAAAQNCAIALGMPEKARTLADRAQELTEAIATTWDENKSMYPDSIHDDGSVSQVNSVHSSALALLYDIPKDTEQGALLRHITVQPEDMVPISSPFAIMFLFEAMEKVGLADHIVAAILENYRPMLEADSSTVWEVFPISGDHPAKFPTRSHCHAWSSSPVYFLPRVILGIKQIEVGGHSFSISPRLNGLRWARGAVASALGPVAVSWRVDGTVLDIVTTSVEGMVLEFASNNTWKGLSVRINGDERPELSVT